MYVFYNSLRLQVTVLNTDFLRRVYVFYNSLCLQVTVLNTDFLRRVYETGGHANYLLSILPSSLKAILALERLYAAHTLQANISTLGCLDPVCDGGDLLDVVANVSFGKWLRTSGNGSYSAVIVNSRAGSPSFTASETGALYAAVLNSTVLGSEAFSSPSPGSAVHTECGAWARSLCLGQPLPASLASLDSSLCGLAHVLRACQSGSVQQPAVRAMLTSAFCAPGLPFCLDLSSTTVHVLSAYFEAFRDFILQHLLRVVHDYFLAQNNRDLVVTRSQSELTLGYYVSDDAEQSAQHVQGFLDEDWLKTSSQEGLVWKVDTCLKDRNMNSNMRVRGRTNFFLCLVSRYAHKKTQISLCAFFRYAHKDPKLLSTFKKIINILVFVYIYCAPYQIHNFANA